MAVSINSNSSIQPSGATEGYKQYQQDKVSPKGSKRRLWLGQKKFVQLEYTALTLAQYTTLTGFFYGTSASVTYANSDTGLSLTGFATAQEQAYYKGNTYLRDMTVSIEEA